MAQVWSTSVKVNTTDSGPDGNDQTQPSIAALGDGYVVVWYDPSPGDRDYIRAQKYGFLGQKIGDEFIVSDLANVVSRDPDVTALANGGFAVTYETAAASIDLSIFNASGTRVSDVAILTGQNGGADPFVVAQPDGGMYVTWEMDVSGERVVRGVLVSATGEMGTVRTVFTGDDTVHNLDAASFSNGDIVSFFARDDLDEGVPGISGDRFLGFKYINEDGTLGLSRRIASATELHHINLDSAHVTRVPGFGLAFAWTQLTPFVGEGVQVRVYDTSGNLIVTDSIVAFGQDWVVEDILGYEQSNGQGGAFTVIYRNDATDELRGQDYDEDGDRLGAEYHIADNVQDAQMSAMDDGRISVAITRTSEGNADIRTFILDPRPVFVTGTEGSDSLTGRPSATIVSGLGGDDLLYGRNGADGLNGGDGDDIMLGNGGNDILTGGRGEDAYSGGSGNDTASFVDLDFSEGKPLTGFRTAFQVSLEDGLAVLRHVSLLSPDIKIEIVDTLSSIENVRGSNFDEDIEGNGGANRISGTTGDKRYFGRGGNDILISGSGNDLLDGGAGADRMEGGDGNDIYVTENVSDVIVENGTGKDVIYAINYITFNMNLTPNVEELRYSYIEGGLTQVTGNALDNVILQEGYRRLDGGQPPGNDILDGGAGDDLLGGGEGDDTYRVDSSLDQVFEDSRPTGGVDTVESTASSYSLSAMTTGRVENLIFTGTGAFTGSGNDFANVIRGGVAGDVLSGEGGKDSLVGLAGNDDLSGGNGNDELSGGIGEDELTGGLGSDSFVFTGLNEGADTIEDFSSTGSGNNDRLTFELADIGQLLGNRPMARES